MSNALAKSHGLDTPYGALIRSVVKDSPADKAGLQRSDLITELAGVKLDNSRLLSRRVAEAPIGETLKVTYIRKRKTKTANVVIERLKEKKTTEDKIREEVEDGNAERSANGIYVEALTEDIRTKYRVKSEIKGVRVVKVDKRAEATGKILKGDIIEEV